MTLFMLFPSGSANLIRFGVKKWSAAMARVGASNLMGLTDANYPEAISSRMRIAAMNSLKRKRLVIPASSECHDSKESDKAHHVHRMLEDRWSQFCNPFRAPALVTFLARIFCKSARGETAGPIKQLILTLANRPQLHEGALSSVICRREHSYW